MTHGLTESAGRTYWEILGSQRQQSRSHADSAAPSRNGWFMRWTQAARGMNAADAEQHLHPMPLSGWDTLLAPYAAWGQAEGTDRGLRDIESAASRLADAVQEATKSGGKGIGISGDYDCDGNCSTALMVRFLQASGVPREKLHVHIPNRKSDGYGVNKRAVSDMNLKDVGTLVTLDNGTLAHAPLEDAIRRGMHAVVIDHHPNSPDHPLPAGALVVNPKRADEPLRTESQGVADLAAVGVTWMVARRAAEILDARGHYAMQHIAKPDANDWLGLVALATVGDVVNIKRPLNRALVAEGLNCIRRGADPYITALAEAARVPDVSQLKTSDIAFSLTPVVNAPGRLGQSVAWAFLTPPDATNHDITTLVASAREEVQSFHRGLARTRDEIRSQPWLDPSGDLQRRMQQNLHKEVAEPDLLQAPPGLSMTQHLLLMLSVQANDKRKDIEAGLVRQAVPMAQAMIGDDPQHPKCETLLLAKEGWHEGVIGIAAGRLKEMFNMPVMIASIDPETGMCKASARSVRTPDESVDVGSFVRHACEKEGLMVKAGGHPMAAGCSFPRENLESIRSRMEAVLGPAAKKARCEQKKPLAAAFNLVELKQSSNRPLREVLQQLHDDQQQGEPYGEGAAKPTFALFGSRISQVLTQRNGRDIRFLATPNMPLAADAVHVTAFKAVGTAIEKLLREADRGSKPIEYVLIGTLESSHHGEGIEFRLDDIVPVRLQGEHPSMQQRQAAVAASLGLSPAKGSILSSSVQL